MLPSTVRRLAKAAPQSPLLASFSPAAARITSSSSFTLISNNPTCNPQRRYSSSKPSSPNDSPKGYPDGQVTAGPSQSTKQNSEKQSGEKRKRKAKETSAQRKLPSVPSTQDVPQEGMISFSTRMMPRTLCLDYSCKIFTDLFLSI